MGAELLTPILINIVIPEVAALFRLMHSRGLPPPTDAEILAALNLDADRVTAIGQAFLNQTKPSA
jgi:hypothetical protein